MKYEVKIELKIESWKQKSSKANVSFRTFL